MEDPRLERLLDYTKFHIGIYLSVFGGMATAVAAAASEPKTFQILNSIFVQRWALLAAVLFMAIAGAAGGVIASGCTQVKTFPDIWDKKQGPGSSQIMTGKHWALLEHSSFWLSIGFLCISLLGSRHVWNWFFV